MNESYDFCYNKPLASMSEAADAPATDDMPVA